MLLSVVHNASEFLNGSDKTIKIENTYVDDKAIPSILRNNTILNFPIEGQSLELQAVQNDSATLTKLKTITDYAIFDILFKDEYGYEQFRKYLTPYRHNLTIINRSLMGYVEKIRVMFYVDNFKFNDFKIFGNLLQDVFKDNNINAEIINKYNYFNCVLLPTNSIEHMFYDGGIFTHKMLKAYKRPKNHRSYKPELYPIVLELFKELGFLPVSIYGSMQDKTYFYHEPTNVKGFLWYPNSPFNLWHKDPNKKINIYDLFASKYKYSNFVEKQTIDEKISPVGTQLEITEEKVDLSQLTESNKRFFSQWSNKTDNSILCIKSAMGTAKTDVIRKLMESNKTLIITPRTQLAVDLAKRTGAQCYLDDNIDYNKHLVCQFDSLFKFDVSQYKYFIIDEYMTLESHIVQCNAQTLVKNMAKMQYILNSNVILIDAMLTKNCLDIFSNQRRNAHWYENSVVDNTPLMSHKTFNSFLKEISNAQGKRITISCTSKSKLLSLQSFVASIGYTNKIIIGETPNSERIRILEEFKDDKFKCLLYSPALSVGVSIESPVEKHFHYDPGGIVSPIQSIQMIRRARKTKQIDVFLQKRKRFATSSIEEIRNEIRNSGILCEYDVKGEQRLSQAGKTYAWMIRHDNIWRLEGRDSFDYLASLNFSVTNNVEAKDSGEFKGEILRKFKDNADKWSIDLRQKSLEYFGDNIHVENLIEPAELETFKYYCDLKKCYLSPLNIEFTKLYYYNKGNYNFENDLFIFTKVLDNPGSFKSKDELGYLGLEYTGFIFNKKWAEKTKFKKLYYELYEKNS